MTPSAPDPRAELGRAARDELALRLRADPSVRLSGVVLCGGRSTRMERDKARVELDGQSLIAHAIETLEHVTDPVALACGSTARYAEFGRELALDRVQDGGPLAGIEAGLAASAPGWVGFLAVDLPRVDSAFLATLFARALDENLDVCLTRSPAGPEPLCGVYHTRLLPRLRALIDRGERKVTSLLEFELAEHPLPRMEWFEVAAGHGATTNVNTPADLEALRARRDSLDRLRKATA